MTLLLPKIETRQRSIHYDGMIYPVHPTMTATTTTTTTPSDVRLTGLPKNKTGLYAAETVQDVRPSKNHHLIGLTSVSPRFRQQLTSHIITGAASIVSSDRQSQSSVGPTSTISANSDLRRNAFPPSPVRRQKMRMTTITSQRETHKQDSRDHSSKQSLYSSPASARLKAEIDHIQSKLKVHHDLNKALLSLPKQEPNNTGVSPSALSYTTSCRISSASTIHNHSRMHPRLPSAVTTTTTTNFTMMPTMLDSSVRSLNSSLSYPAPTPPTREDEILPKTEINDRITHAYQIPQLSNVGSESLFVANPTQTSSILTPRSSRHRRGNQLLTACPFYVMYFSNLSLHQKNTENLEEISKKTPRPSRGTSSHYQRFTTVPNSKRSSSSEDDNGQFPSSSYQQHKNFTAKITAFENENSHLLKDLLRTTSWNHVQV